MVEIYNRFNDIVFKDKSTDMRTAIACAMRDKISLADANINNADLDSLLLKLELLKNVRFDHCSFRNASFFGAPMKIGALTGVTFWACDLSHASFGGNALQNVTFNECNLSNTSFSRSKIRNTEFVDCNLSEIYLNDADLTKEQIKKLQRKNHLSILFDLPGTLYAYKFVDNHYQTTYQNFQYEIGKSYDFTKETNSNPLATCGPGLNVATIDWCIKRRSYIKG